MNTKMIVEDVTGQKHDWLIDSENWLFSPLNLKEPIGIQPEPNQPFKWIHGGKTTERVICTIETPEQTIVLTVPSDQLYKVRPEILNLP